MIFLIVLLSSTINKLIIVVILNCILKEMYITKFPVLNILKMSFLDYSLLAKNDQ